MGGDGARSKVTCHNKENAEGGTMLCSTVSAPSRPVRVDVNRGGIWKTDATQRIQSVKIKKFMGNRNYIERRDNNGFAMVVKRNQRGKETCNREEADRFDNVNGRIPDRLGCVFGRRECRRSVEHEDVIRTQQLSGAYGHPSGYSNIRRKDNRKNYTFVDRQYDGTCLSDTRRWAEQEVQHINKGNSEHFNKNKLQGTVQSLKWSSKYRGGHSIKGEGLVQLRIREQVVCDSTDDLRAAHNRSVCRLRKQQASSIQRFIRRPTCCGRGRVDSERLGWRKQLRFPAISSYRSCAGHCGAAGSGSDADRAPLEGPDVVQTSAADECGRAAGHTKHVGELSKDLEILYSGTSEEQKMESGGMANFWEKTVSSKCGWSSRPAKQLIFSLAPSTIRTYDAAMLRFKQFCDVNNVVFSNVESADVANFLCEVADESNKPRSTLKVTYSALQSYYNMCDGVSPMNFMINKLITALIKSSTTQPMQRSTAMPVRYFSDLFLKWKPNDDLSLKNLRLKCITLLALALMLRPSDIAPRTVTFDPVTGKNKKIIFSTKQILFNDDGSACVKFFGVKNDTSREGFQVRLPPHSVSKLCPVKTLKDYIEITDKCRDYTTKPLLLSLVRPYGPLCSQQVSSILNESIQLAGLGGQGFSARLFRCSGATAAIEGGADGEVVRKLGRWKTSHVFYEHYVHARTPSSLIHAIIPS